MKLRVAANVGFLFQERASLVERFAAARASGFAAIEVPFPYDVDVARLKAAQRSNALDVVLINSHRGNASIGESGLAALPDRKREFLDKLDVSIRYAKELGCPRIHIMAGKVAPGSDRRSMEATFVDNLRFAASRLEQENMMALIEPINEVSVPDYFLNNYEDAIRYITEIGSRHLKLQLDVFHLQMICGGLTRRITEYFPLIGHIQVAQAPDRWEPNGQGEIDYGYVFGLLKRLGYEGWIGGEYNPVGSTEEGLAWIPEYDLAVE